MRTRASTSSAGSSSQQTRQAIGEKSKLLGSVPAKRARTAKKSASNAERIESLQAIALHNQTPTVINPSVSLEKQEPSNALNSISSQVSQVQNTLAKFQGTVERVDRMSQDVQKALTTIQSPTLGRTQYSLWHPYPYAPYPVPPSLCPSSYPYPSYPHPLYLHPPCLHPSYPWPPYQQQHIHLPAQASEQVPPSDAMTPPPPYHPQDPLSLAFPYYPQNIQPISMGYKMLPDRGALTVRAAWDEFHGPLSQLKSQGLYSNDAKTKKAYNRRREFVLLVQEAAERENRPVEVLVDEWTNRFRGQTINSIREELKANKI
ncbi:hypothetical protein K457DRAFT_139087 [Linnemannia elongata AG-77]|uniref:Uncharacterized protein n=1 Tax=Linnemannia elongata AG-77 TaxID=1314771 RepID=A0A197JUI9_9FUNG|nr:hypothetical protein K457DRAFT_139087 [Linnemannia elongata AG-77]